MIRVAILLSVLVLGFLFFKKFKDDKDLNKEIGFVLVFLFVLILYHQNYTNQIQDKVTKLLIAFKEGKVLVCQDNKVDKEHFDFESGTMVFISREIVDIKYPITSCKVKK